jgi:hypothetical protein
VRNTNAVAERSPKWSIRGLISSPAVWAFAVTFAALAIHPLPECIACEYSRPWESTSAPGCSNALAGSNRIRRRFIVRTTRWDALRRRASKRPG